VSLSFEEDELGAFVVATRVAKDPFPRPLDVVEDEGHEVHQLAIGVGTGRR
jgi:hypothetical protein